MIPGVAPGTEKRTELLKVCCLKNMPLDILEKLEEPMEGKPDEEKERIAEDLLRQLQIHE